MPKDFASQAEGLVPTSGGNIVSLAAFDPQVLQALFWSSTLPVMFGKNSTTKLIAQSLESRESDEAKALGYMQRLNLAGADVKGQISSAYAQSGFGLGIDAKFDFGALLVPFVHLDVGLSMAGARTAHALLVLQRLPKIAWFEDHPRPPQLPKQALLGQPGVAPPSPAWMAQRPVALALLRGRTIKLDVKLYTAAWAGFGSFDDFDETGLTLGVKVSGGGGGSVTRLVDVQPRHYPPSHDTSSLRDDVDDLFDDRLKARVAAWIVSCVEGAKQLDSYGVPAAPLRERAEDDGLEDDAKAALLTTLDYYDKLTVNDVDSTSVAGLGLDVVKALGSAAKKVIALVQSKTLKTDDLLSELATIEPVLFALVERFKHKEGNELLPGDVRKDLWDAAVRRHREVRELTKALKRRKDRNARRTTPQPLPAPATASPPFHLDIAVLEGRLDAAAGTQFVLPRGAVAAKLTLEGTRQTRRIAFRYQATVPGSGRRTLLCSQDTAVHYVSRRKTITGAASAFGVSAKPFLDDRPNLVTMSYRSVYVQWFDDQLTNHHQALPNGSGVSFGLSVLAESLDNYRTACTQRGKPKAGAPWPPLDPAFDELEAAMVKQLRITKDELRTFLADMPPCLDEAVLDDKDKSKIESFLVESSFAFTTQQKLTIVKHRPEKLFDLPVVADLVGKGPRPAGLRLQVLRLRFRVRTDDDKSRSLINLGWNPEPWGEGAKPWGKGSVDGEQPWYVRLTGVDPQLPNYLKLPALALQLGLGVERVQRVGSEGIVELHQMILPAPYDPADPPQGYGLAVAEQLENKNRRHIAELLVPPVALFSQ